MRHERKTRTTPRLLALGAALVTLVTASCSDSPSSIVPREDPQPGTASVAVTANPEGATALILRIQGGPVQEVQAVGDAIVYWESDPSGARAAIVLPDAATGTIARVSLPDIQALGNYSITVLETADILNDAIETSSIALELR